VLAEIALGLTEIALGLTEIASRSSNRVVSRSVCDLSEGDLSGRGSSLIQSGNKFAEGTVITINLSVSGSSLLTAMTSELQT
jgi:hypothetical protein